MSNDAPAPVPSPDTAPFWSSLREHVLRLPHCTSCDRFHFPPMPGCPECGADADRIEMRRVAGTGHVHSWFVAHHAFHPAFEDEVPYVVLDVQLDEGPRLNGRFVGAPDAVSPDLRVRVRFEDHAGFTLPAFHEAAEDGR